MYKALLISILAAIGLAGCGMPFALTYESQDPDFRPSRPSQTSARILDGTTVEYSCSICGECRPEFVGLGGCTKRLPVCANACSVTYRCESTLETFDVGHGKCVEVIWVNDPSR